MFQPLEDEIRESLIPALCGRPVSDIERRILALPYRYGGLGIVNPVVAAVIEYNTSKVLTADLAGIIQRQKMSLEGLDQEKMREAKADVRG